MKHLPFYKKKKYSHRIRKVEAWLTPADQQTFEYLWQCKNRHTHIYACMHASSFMSTIKNAQHLFIELCIQNFSTCLLCVCRTHSLYGINMNASIHAHEFQTKWFCVSMQCIYVCLCYCARSRLLA